MYILNPFEVAATWNAAMSNIFEAAVQMQVGAGMMVLETMQKGTHKVPTYAADRNVIYPQALTPRRFEQHSG